MVRYTLILFESIEICVHVIVVRWFFFFILPIKGTIENRRCTSVTPWHIWGALNPFNCFHRQDEASQMQGIFFCLKTEYLRLWPLATNGGSLLVPLYIKYISLFSIVKMKHPRCQASIWNVPKIFLITWQICLKKSDCCQKPEDVICSPLPWGAFPTSPLTNIHFLFLHLHDKASMNPQYQASILDVPTIFLMNWKTCLKKSDLRRKPEDVHL